MTKHTYHALLLIAACLVVVSAAGCGAAQTAVSQSGGQTPQTAVVSTVSAPTTQQAPVTESTEPTTQQAPTTETTEAATECNWTLEVSDTQTSQVNGYDLTCTLSIMAIKLGGTDDLGAYRGIVTFDYKYDMQQGGVSGNAKGGGQEVDAIIEVVKYDEAAYDANENQALAPLMTFDGMAIGNLILKGSGVANEQAGGGSWSTEESKTVTVPYKLTVDGGQVKIRLTTVAPAATFSGMITGTPI
jgi:hypothetical protein